MPWLALTYDRCVQRDELQSRCLGLLLLMTVVFRATNIRADALACPYLWPLCSRRRTSEQIPWLALTYDHCVHCDEHQSRCLGLLLLMTIAFRATNIRADSWLALTYDHCVQGDEHQSRFLACPYLWPLCSGRRTSEQMPWLALTYHHCVQDAQHQINRKWS